MKSLFLVLSTIALVACAPKIYVIDRETVLEQEAAGEWPDFEHDILNGASLSGPTPFSRTPINDSRARLYNVPNGELVKADPTTAAEATK